MPGSPRDVRRVMDVARVLLADGYFASEVDAVVAAIRVLAAAESLGACGCADHSNAQHPAQPLPLLGT